MKCARSVGLCTVMILLSSIADAGSKSKDAGVSQARAGIEAANAKFSEAFDRGDAAAVAALYTEDAIVFPPDSEMVKGRQAIGEFWKATRNSGERGEKTLT